jgi:AraC family transcriptional regulator
VRQNGGFMARGLSTGRFFGERVKNCALEGFKLSELSYSPEFQGTPPHFHEHSLIKINIEGAFKHSFEGNVAWTSTPWTLDYCPSGVVHWHNSHQSRVRLLVIEVDPARLDADQNQPEALRSPANLRGQQHRWLLSRLYRGFREMDCDSASCLEVEGVLLLLLSEVARAKNHDFRSPPWLRRVRDIVHDRYREALSLKQIAAEVDVHPAWLASSFHKAYGQTVGEAIRQFRVEYASKQLSETDRPVAEVALEAGFADQSHFSNVFRRFTGMTPSQYRREVGTRSLRKSCLPNELHGPGAQAPA